MNHPTSRILVSVSLIIAGIAIELTVIDVISINENLVHAPDWIIALCGLLFLSSGLAVAASPKSTIATWSAGTLVISMTLISGWVAVYGPSEQFSGDFPIISRDSNVIIARLNFGCVSLLGLTITVAAARKTWSQRG
jgi:hypothetical protein